MKNLRKLFIPAVMSFAAFAEAAPPASSGQVELCMIGDSITWWNYGDCWRKYLLEHMPNLAFIGTHTAKFGYSHAGEGGNGTRQVLKRIDEIPASRYYNLLIGTNNNGVKNESQIESRAQKTAADIVKIANILASRPRTAKVFLGSLLPTVPDNYPRTDHPLRDRTNSRTNEILREKFSTFFPSGKVVWVEYEKKLRPRKDWKRIIRLHPIPEGYKVIAGILADTLKKETVAEPSVKDSKRGVEVVNLWQGGSDGTTVSAPINGWYVVSFKVKSVGSKPSVRIYAGESKNPRGINITPKSLNTGARAVAVVRSNEISLKSKLWSKKWRMKTKDIEISDILVEKMRPSGVASVYGKGTYVDAVSPIMPGEKVVSAK